MSTSVRRFGTGSAFFDGSGNDWLLVPNGRDSLKFRSDEDGTIDFWFLTTSGTNQVMVSSHLVSHTSQHSGFTVGIFKSEQTLWVAMHYQTDIYGSGDVSKDVWHHCALVRRSGTAYLYMDGSLQGSKSTAHDWNPNQYDMAIGAHREGGRNFKGYIASRDSAEHVFFA